MAKQQSMKADQIGGLVTASFGLIAIVEAIRLFPDRMSFMVGDHTLPGLIGLTMVLLGGLLVFTRGEKFHIEFPKGKLMASMVGTLAIMFAYWFFISYLGYVISTLLALTALFKVIGLYNLWKSALYGAIATTCLYLLFIYWLQMSFPDGLFGF
jgi:putative tricarboxylic transport membrane protein